MDEKIFFIKGTDSSQRYEDEIEKIQEKLDNGWTVKHLQTVPTESWSYPNIIFVLVKPIELWENLSNQEDE
jgi:hypothetical protein